MLFNQAQSGLTTALLHPVSAAATVNATSAWVDVRGGVGDLMFTVQTGAVTGSITWTIEDATDGAGAGAAAVTPNEGAFAAGAATQVQRRSINCSSVRGWVRLVGTIVTGPSLVAANVSRRAKYTV